MAEPLLFTLALFDHPSSTVYMGRLSVASDVRLMELLNAGDVAEMRDADGGVRQVLLIISYVHTSAPSLSPWRSIGQQLASISCQPFRLRPAPSLS